MCLILFAWRAHPRYRLVLAANRDEFRARPAASADWWEGGRVWGGRDLTAGGTWLAVDRRGRFAGVTNVREAAERHGPKHVRSRGTLPSDFLQGAVSPAAFVMQRRPFGDEFGPHNLLVADETELHWWSNRAAHGLVQPGVHGLSNAALDTPWPKVVSGVAALKAALEVEEPDVDGLFALLHDRTIAPDADLPDTGFGLDMERTLSPRFLAGSTYGTRASTVLLIGDVVSAHERRFDEVGHETGRSEVTFEMNTQETES